MTRKSGARLAKERAIDDRQAVQAQMAQMNPLMLSMQKAQAEFKSADAALGLATKMLEVLNDIPKSGRSEPELTEGVDLKLTSCRRMFVVKGLALINAIEGLSETLSPPEPDEPPVVTGEPASNTFTDEERAELLGRARAK
jgi:hypothetical protein